MTVDEFIRRVEAWRAQRGKLPKRLPAEMLIEVYEDLTASADPTVVMAREVADPLFQEAGRLEQRYREPRDRLRRAPATQDFVSVGRSALLDLVRLLIDARPEIGIGMEHRQGQVIVGLAVVDPEGPPIQERGQMAGRRRATRQDDVS